MALSKFKRALRLQIKADKHYASSYRPRGKDDALTFRCETRRLAEKGHINYINQHANRHARKQTI